MKISAVKFSLFIFAPVFLILLLPAVFLLPAGVLITLLSLFDSTLSPSDVISYVLWILGPLCAALGIFAVGLGLYALHQRGGSPFAAWISTWVVVSVSLFLAIWCGVTVLTSIGASETPALDFLKFTALIAAGLTLLAQALLIPWLKVAARQLSRIN